MLGIVVGNGHQLAVAFAELVDFNGTDIHTGYHNTKCILQTLGKIIFDSIVDLCSLAFNLDHRVIQIRKKDMLKSTNLMLRRS